MTQPGNAAADSAASWLLSLRAHNVLVTQRINRYIEAAFQSAIRAKGSPTVVDVLETAQDLAEKARTGPHDEIGRDAEYYLKSRWQVAKRESLEAKNIVAFGGTGLNVIYSGLKVAAIGLGFEEAMRTDADIPVSPPGGIIWGSFGCDDGIRDEGMLQGMPKLVTATGYSGERFAR
ncbi:hypothetical protein VVD49_04095 [Uliginosibacterium sp. H3]|uniref:Uncharacterized protein n=1 Tax=Uliginosibacterium silvisoli TaxID=3114758 RepID=A0ABU6JYZ7_9RHOO|nr:hypothetical protein [Uliginosibacterium sp. H3]